MTISKTTLVLRSVANIFFYFEFINVFVKMKIELNFNHLESYKTKIKYIENKNNYEILKKFNPIY